MLLFFEQMYTVVLYFVNFLDMFSLAFHEKKKPCIIYCFKLYLFHDKKEREITFIYLLTDDAGPCFIRCFSIKYKQVQHVVFLNLSVVVEHDQGNDAD